MAWRVRFEGSATVVEADTAQRVVDGLRDGDWEPTDEVRGPDDPDWTAIEEHPQFAEAVSELAPPLTHKPDETRLDMNPLIDVALVLLIFFIITTTYSSLRRSIEVPAPSEEKGKSETTKPKPEELIERTFRVEAWMDGETPRIKVEDKLVDPADLEKEVKAVIASTRRNEMMLEVDGKVPWGVEALIHDAAKGADVHHIYRKPKKAGG
jgi:biopolymer transport protein ExbD